MINEGQIPLKGTLVSVSVAHGLFGDGLACFLILLGNHIYFFCSFLGPLLSLLNSQAVLNVQHPVPSREEECPLCRRSAEVRGSALHAHPTSFPCT